MCAGQGHEVTAVIISLSPSGCLEDLNSFTSSSLAEPGNLEFKVKGSKGPGQRPSKVGDSRSGVTLGGGC